MLNHNNIKLARDKGMEQLQAIKKILKIHTFQDVRVSYLGFIGSTELITFSCLIALICSVILRNINPNYIIIGTLVPIYLSCKGVKIENYWECFALFLLIRRFTIVLAFLDVTELTFRFLY
mgnify:CR=1 FL=1